VVFFFSRRAKKLFGKKRDRENKVETKLSFFLLLLLLWGRGDIVIYKYLKKKVI
jgi:hypothetical protein